MHHGQHSFNDAQYIPTDEPAATSIPFPPIFPQPMKILFYHSLPFALAHGGMQTHIEQTQAALQSIGLEVEPVRWWDNSQKGDLIHYFGIAPLDHIHFAQAKGIPVVITTLLAVTCNRSDFRLRLQGWPRAHRHAAAANGKTPGQQGGALPPPGWPPLRAGRPARSPTKTRAPLHQPPQMNIPVLKTTRHTVGRMLPTG